MPYYYLYKYLPGFASMRVASRFGLLVLLSLSILSGFGAHRILTRLNDRTKTICTIIIVSIVLIETFPTFADRGMITHTIPVGGDIPEVYNWLADQPDNTSVLELPVKNILFNSQYMYYSTYHWKKMVNGYSGFLPSNYNEVVNIMNGFPSTESIDLIREYNVTYIIVHSDYVKTTEWNIQKSKIDNCSDVSLEKIIGDDYVYRVT
jgi:hypothetical protein